MAGKSRGPYKLKRSVNESLYESSTEGEGSEVGTNSGMCTKCKPILSRYIDAFKSMKKRGSSLEMVKRIRPLQVNVSFLVLRPHKFLMIEFIMTNLVPIYMYRERV